MSKENSNQKKETAYNGMEELVRRDDALFDALGKSKKQKKRRLLKIIVSIVLIVAIVLVVAVSVLRRRVQEQFGSNEPNVLTYQVTTGTISTVVSGSGTLANVDTETVTVPEGVEIRDILVENGDTVTEGQLLATADQASVGTAMSALQTTIEDLDDQISDAEDDKVSSYIKAGVAGRVKKIWAGEDMTVSDCMVEHGALALISLDGFMAVDLETDLLSVGDQVVVITAEGEELEGTVELSANGSATVLVTDDGTEYDAEVTVKTRDGTEVGKGRLYIHNPLSVTGYAGTVSRVNVKENQKVYANTTVLILKDTASSANYDALLRSRAEAEETLLELLKIQRSGGITAPISGSVYSITEGYTDLMVLSPDKQMSVTITVDESDILSLEIDQQVEITVSSVGEETFSGVVTEIDRTASTGYFTAVVTLDKAEGMLPGMTASVDVRIEGVENALIVPIEAINKTSNSTYVYTSYDAENQEYGGKVEVVVGLSGSNYVEIKSGLAEGDTVYYTKTLTLADMFGAMGFGGNRGGQSGNNPGGPGGNPGGERPDSGNRD